MKIKAVWIGGPPACHMVMVASYKTGASLGQSRLSLHYYITVAVRHSTLDLVQRKPEVIYLTNSPPQRPVCFLLKQIMMKCG